MLIKIRAFGKEAIKNEKGESWKFWNLCKCHQQILWIKTINGKNMPVNARLITYRVPKEGKGKERIVTPNGETVSAEIVQPGTQDATGVGYISHFATCPVANMFRRK